MIKKYRWVIEGVTSCGNKFKSSGSYATVEKSTAYECMAQAIERETRAGNMIVSARVNIEY